MSNIKFICCQPQEQYFVWQVHAWIEALKKINQSQNAIVLIFIPDKKEFNNEWKKIEYLYPESTFLYIKGDKFITDIYYNLYLPICRPYLLKKYWELNPEIKNYNIFYCDCDVLITDKLNINHLLNNNICYLSDTNNYINSTYFESKINDVIDFKLEEYKKKDILSEIISYIGVSKEIAIKNNENSGGCQYLLKNINTLFWEKVIYDIISIKKYLNNINKVYFENESKGFQSWCTDMWAILWNLWYFNYETKVVKEMNFIWATDDIEKLNTCGIFHNAGLIDKFIDNKPYFYKGAYHTGQDPFNDKEHLENIIKNNTTKATYFYTKFLLELKEKYNLKY